MKRTLGMMFLLVLAATAWAEPTVDGKVTASEYTSHKALIDGAATLFWTPDGKGGVFLALKAKAHGWIGLGLGSQRMDGAYIYLAYVEKDGKPVFSEQEGHGHRHRASEKITADHWAVTESGAETTMEFHIPADRLPAKTAQIPFIVAFSDAKDLTTFHEGNFDSGSFRL